MKRFLGTPLSGYGPPLVLLAVTLVYLVTGYTYRPEARGFPVTVAWAMLVLLALDIASRTKTPIGETLIRWLNPAAAPDKAEVHQRYTLSRQFSAVAWLAGFVVLMVVVGILYSVPIYVFASVFLKGRQPLWLSIVVSGAVTLFVWLLFTMILELELYPGLLFGVP